MVVAGQVNFEQFKVLAEFEGEQQQAEEQAWSYVADYEPEHPRRVRRRRLFRTADGWMLLAYGASGKSFPYRFSLCRQLSDSSDRGIEDAPR